MKQRAYIPLIIGLFAALIALLVLAGCGEEQQTSSLPECDPNAPSLIPASQGKPMLVYFYKDT